MTQAMKQIVWRQIPLSEWIPQGDIESNGAETVICKNCGAKDIHNVKYCPDIPWCWKCGAWMMEELPEGSVIVEPV